MALKQLLTNLSDPSTPVDSSAYPTQASHLEGVTFNQKIFRFGEGRASDRSGGGFSREPFIGNPKALIGSNTSDLSNSNDSLSGFEDALEMVDGVTDGLVRGGIVTALKRSVKDTQRLTNFYFSGRGVGFLLKQTLLQATNPSIEDGGISILGLRRNRQFLPIGTNLLAQSLVNFSGVHFDRAGLLPIWPEDKKYETVVRDKANDAGHLSITSKKTNTFDGNRLITLLDDRIKPHVYGMLDGGDLEEKSAEERSALGKAWDSTKNTIKDALGKNDSMLYEYGAGPGSTYGIGRTSIRRFENTLTSPNFNKSYVRRIGDTIDTSKNPNGVVEAPNVFNYLKVLGRGGFDYQGDAGIGRKYYRESRIGTGNPGVPYTKGPTDSYATLKWGTTHNYSSKVDKVNLLDIVKFNGRPVIPEARDLIKFRFEAVDNDNPTESNVMVFRAFLDDLKDNYNASYNEFNYNGRGENFYTYNSFKRDINFSFKVAAQTRHEMMPLYRKLNYLASQTAPEYKNGRMRAGFVRLTIGSWVDRIPGFVQSVNLSWQKDYPWEISLDSPEGGQDTAMLVLPHVLDVSVSFLPVHNFLPQRSVKDSPFILKDKEGISNDGQRWSELDVADTTAEALKLGKQKLLTQLRPALPPTIEVDEMDIEEFEEEEEDEAIVFEQSPTVTNATSPPPYNGPFVN
tara:strand:+ start:2543 stop:4588 length:2046 start_codon:yes stop_codon:yes gene_type:complete